MYICPAVCGHVLVTAIGDSRLKTPGMPLEFAGFLAVVAEIPWVLLDFGPFVLRDNNVIQPDDHSDGQEKRAREYGQYYLCIYHKSYHIPI
jgi:hypothetical protein